jgi:subtilisin family serine protease
MAMAMTAITQRAAIASSSRAPRLPIGFVLLLGASLATAQEVPAREGASRALAAEQAAVQALRDRLGARSAELTVVASARASFPALGRSVHELKVRDARGAIHGIALDDALRPVDVQELAAAERAARRRRDGALDPSLAEQLQQFPSVPHPVILWLVDGSSTRRARTPPNAERATPTQIDEAYAENEKARTAALAGQIAAMLERLRKVDPAARADGASPAIYMSANAEALQTLARDPDINRIYPQLRATSEMGDVAKQTTGISALQLGGLKGDGVRIAMTEEEGRVEPASLLLNPILQDSANVCATTSAHTTEVASIIKGRRITIFGVTVGVDGAAPNVELRVGGSCSGNTSELQDASTRAADWGARVISMSWGHDTQNIASGADRFYDDMVFNRWRTVVKSAGNRACATPGDPSSGAGSGMTTSPGLGYNVIAVGGFDDRDTPTWSDDSVYVCSSFANPISTHNDREKPELSAPAVNLTVATVGPANLTVDSGTSGASPIVASAAALMIQRSARLAVWPEIIRATLMATATHNIEGSRRLSDIDGAGGLNAGEAVSLAQDTQRTGGTWYTCDSSTATPLDLATLTVSPRTRQRIVLSWDTDPSYSDYGSQPSADIDLEVVDSNGRVLAASRSFDNTNEIVDFSTFQSATMTVRAIKFRCDLSTWLAWAWHTTPMP